MYHTTASIMQYSWIVRPEIHCILNMPEWGNLDILEACGASDSGSNPGSGAMLKIRLRF